MKTFQKVNVGYQESAKLLRVIAHPVRLAILDILSSSEECVCHLEAILGYRQAYLSQHLMVLRNAKLIIDMKTGRNVYYRIADNNLKYLLTSIDLMYGNKASPIIDRIQDCSCPKCKGTLIGAKNFINERIE